MKILEEYDFENGSATWSIQNAEGEHQVYLVTHYNENGAYTYFALRDAYRKLAAFMEWDY